MIKAAFFDLDGTLYSHAGRKIPEDAVRALQALHENGILVYLATGRHPLEIELLDLEGIWLDGSVVINGQLVLDHRNQPVWKRPFSASVAQALASLAASRRFPMSLVEADRFYINYIDETVLRAQEGVSVPLPPTGTWAGAELYGAVVYFSRDEEWRLAGQLPEGVAITRWNDWGLDLADAAAGKKAGLEAVGRLRGIEAKEMIAFGDSDNDESMLRYAGIGVAMGNACPNIQAAADYVTAHQDEGGIARACLHFGLIRPDQLQNAESGE